MHGPRYLLGLQPKAECQRFLWIHGGRRIPAQNTKQGTIRDPGCYYSAKPPSLSHSSAAASPLAIPPTEREKPRQPPSCCCGKRRQSQNVIWLRPETIPMKTSLRSLAWCLLYLRNRTLYYFGDKDGDVWCHVFPAHTLLGKESSAHDWTQRIATAADCFITLFSHAVNVQRIFFTRNDILENESND